MTDLPREPDSRQPDPGPAPTRSPEAVDTPGRASALDRLQRWESAGGTWHVLRRSDQDVTIALCRCDGGEEADRFTSADPALLTHVAGRTSGEA